MKTCTKCGAAKPATAEHFRHHPKGRNGLHPRCRECERKTSHAWFVSNRERHREITAAYKKRRRVETSAARAKWLAIAREAEASP